MPARKAVMDSSDGDGPLQLDERYAIMHRSSDAR